MIAAKAVAATTMDIATMATGSATTATDIVAIATKISRPAAASASAVPVLASVSGVKIGR
jgi:hypothetical protein